jgi:hypothetical protein
VVNRTVIGAFFMTQIMTRDCHEQLFLSELLLVYDENCGDFIRPEAATRDRKTSGTKIPEGGL